MASVALATSHDVVIAWLDIDGGPLGDPPVQRGGRLRGAALDAGNLQQPVVIAFEAWLGDARIVRVRSHATAVHLVLALDAGATLQVVLDHGGGGRFAITTDGPSAIVGTAWLAAASGLAQC